MASSTKLNEQPIKVNDAEAIQNQHQLQKQADGNYLPQCSVPLMLWCYPFLHHLGSEV